MHLVRLAVKNLLRSKRRTVLSSLAVVVGIFYLVVGQSFIGGIEEATVRGAIDGTVGHLTIRPADYPDEPLTFPIDDLLAVTPAMTTWLDAQTGWTGRLTFQTTLVAGQRSSRAQGIAFDPATDDRVFSRAVWAIQGKEPTTAADGALIGQLLARNLEVSAGDTIVLQSRTAAGAINAMPVPIAGVLASGNVLLDAIGIFVTQDLGAELLRTDGVSHISVLVPNRDLADSKAEELRALAGGDVGVVTWITETAELLALQEIRRTMLNVLVSMLLVMSSLAIANTVLMAAHERVREIGTLRAMGMSRGGVVRLFLLEGAMMGGIAGGVGATLGGAVAYNLSVNPLNLSKLMGESGKGGFPVSSFLYGEFSVELIVVPLLISFLVALVASIYPAISASHMEPADAVRGI